MGKILERDSLETWDGLDLYCEHFRTHSPKGVFIIIHGFGEHCGLYRNLASTLQSLDYGVCLYDMRGHGKSPGERGEIVSLDAALDDLDLLLGRVGDQYSNCPLFIIGHNIGASIGATYSLRNKARLGGLILSHIPFQIESNMAQRAMKPLFQMLPGVSSANKPQDFGSLKIKEDPLVHRKALPLVAAIDLDLTHSYICGHASDFSDNVLILGPRRGGRLLDFFDSLASFDKEYWSHLSHPTDLKNDEEFRRWLAKSSVTGKRSAEAQSHLEH